VFSLRIDEIEVTTPRARPLRRFVRGPIAWAGLCAAARLPGKALAVFVAVHHRAALTGEDTVTLPKSLLTELGVSRDAKARALHALEEASLIAIERVSGRTARIKLLAAAKHGG
jgi:hypothetical protein